MIAQPLSCFFEIGSQATQMLKFFNLAVSDVDQMTTFATRTRCVPAPSFTLEFAHNGDRHLYFPGPAPSHILLTDDKRPDLLWAGCSRSNNKFPRHNFSDTTTEELMKQGETDDTKREATRTSVARSG